MNRRSYRFASLLAIVALLFAQAMASVHACDRFTAAKMLPAATGAGHPAGDCCDPGAPRPDPLCDNHCQQGKQALDRDQGASVTPLVTMGFVMPIAIVPWRAHQGPVHAAPDLSRDTAPPISIRNCCFRI